MEKEGSHGVKLRPLAELVLEALSWMRVPWTWDPDL